MGKHYNKVATVVYKWVVLFSPYVVDKKTDVGFNARVADEHAVVLWT